MLSDGEVRTVMEHEEFSLLQMHFHWGVSEHKINNKYYAAELHLVHKSLSHDKKFAVLGFLFEVILADKIIKKKKNKA